MSPASLLLSRLRVRGSWSTSSHAIRKNHQLLSSWAQPITKNLDSEPKTGLSERMSFVFDQIDAIERTRAAKDDALERIRSWRLNQKQEQEQKSPSLVAAEERQTVVHKEEKNLFKNEIELVHPWNEWIEFMERLVDQNYFDHRRFNEDQIVRDLPIDLPGVADDLAFDFTRDWTTVRTACLNFGRDRFDILRSLSKKDLQILVGHGCPSTDRKVVLSAKLLRKLVHLDEGDVCSSCKLRSNCSNGFLLSQKEDEARTIDVVRILLTYGFDPINSSVENKALMEIKTLKKTVRKLLQDVTRLSGVPIDPNLPPPVIKKPPPKIKQPPPAPKRRVGRDDVEMKKGDWICPKCDFMNFAKNNVCLQCDAKRPKRQLLPGEWECPQCNFLNYRRNMACFRCDHRRPPEELTEPEAHFQQPDFRAARPDKFSGLSSQAWNFDFDDNESDGADVAAFEFADPPRRDGIPLNGKGVEFSPPDNSRNGGRFSSNVSRTGFDDFHDEDDDVDSFEIDDRPASEDIPKFECSRASADSDFDDDDDDVFDDVGDDDQLINSLEKDRSTFGPGEVQHKSNLSSDKRGNSGRISRRVSGQHRSYDSDNESLSSSDSENDDLRVSKMDKVHRKGHSRPRGFRELDDNDDQNDDDGTHGPHLGVGREKNLRMKDRLRRERFDNQAFSGPCNEIRGRERSRPSSFRQLDNDDEDDDDDDMDEDNRRAHHDNMMKNAGKKNSFKRGKFDLQAMSGHGKAIHGRGRSAPSNFGLLDDDDDDDRDDDSRHRGFHDGDSRSNMRIKDGFRRERFDHRAMNGRAHEITNRAGSRPSNYHRLDDDDDDDDNHRMRHNGGRGRSTGMKHGSRREKFDNRSSDAPGSGRMAFGRGDRDSEYKERSRGGFNGRGRGGRSDRPNLGSRSHNEFDRGGRFNRHDDGPKRFR